MNLPSIRRLAPVAIGAVAFAIFGAWLIEALSIPYLEEVTFAARVAVIFVGAVFGLAIVIYAVRLDS